jgi:hypothetical protein
MPCTVETRHNEERVSPVLDHAFRTFQIHRNNEHPLLLNCFRFTIVDVSVKGYTTYHDQVLPYSLLMREPNNKTDLGQPWQIMERRRNLH